MRHSAVATCRVRTGARASAWTHSLRAVSSVYGAAAAVCSTSRRACGRALSTAQMSGSWAAATHGKGRRVCVASAGPSIARV
eukprot:6052010-Prymnesium_polylepis.1